MSGAPFDQAYEFRGGRQEMPHWPTGHITLRSGLIVNALAPRPEDIRILDLANGLGNCCRWGKQSRFFSTAEHSVLLADWLGRAYPDHAEFEYWALLHDGSDYVLPDVPSPYKHALPGFIELERAWQGAICTAFGLELACYPLQVGVADQRIRADEAVQAMGTEPANVGVTTAPLGVTLQFWSPQEAGRQWLRRMNKFQHRWRGRGVTP